MDTPPVNGETALLRRLLTVSSEGPEVVVPNGDDAAVVRVAGELVAVTTDTVVEGRHFDLRFSTLREVGVKAVEAAASDIVAMGGEPRHVYLAISTPSGFAVERLEELYTGIHAACARLGALLMGGDTTTGTHEIVATVTVSGAIKGEDRLCTRRGARPGDLLCVSGPLGGAAAGLAALRRGLPGFEHVKSRHRTPVCRNDCIGDLAPRATAMIDVSDGLSSEIHHLCRMSGVGMVLRSGDIPFHPETLELARREGLDVVTLALGGGDDYELLYTVSPADKSAVVGAVIGVVTAERGILIERGGAYTPLVDAGYDHLRG